MVVSHHKRHVKKMNEMVWRQNSRNQDAMKDGVMLILRIAQDVFMKILCGINIFMIEREIGGSKENLTKLSTLYSIFGKISGTRIQLKHWVPANLV